MKIELKYPNLSRHQYGDLLYISRNRPTMHQLRLANMNTLTSLAQRGYLFKVGPTDDSEVMLTKAGEEALRLYQQAGMNERMHEADITERCLRLLRYSRRLVMMSKGAA